MMTTEKGFIQAHSDNLPNLDVFMLTSYIASNPDLTSAEDRGIKVARSEQESYGDSAIGYVQLKRLGDICIIKAQITPEHNVYQEAYTVTVTCNESQKLIVYVQCDKCSECFGSCKHAIAFLAWLHRRTEDPPTTSVECYWHKSKLTSGGLKFIKSKDLCNIPRRKYVTKSSVADYKNTFLTIVKEHSKNGGVTNNQIMNYYDMPIKIEK